MLILGDCRREAIKKDLHSFCVHVRHDEREAIVGAGLDGCEDASEREAFIADTRRTFAALPPDVAGAALLADARLVLEKQPDALIFARMLNASQQSRGSF